MYCFNEIKIEAAVNHFLYFAGGGMLIAHYSTNVHRGWGGDGDSTLACLLGDHADPQKVLCLYKGLDGHHCGLVHWEVGGTTVQYSMNWSNIRHLQASKIRCNRLQK